MTKICLSLTLMLLSALPFSARSEDKAAAPAPSPVVKAEEKAKTPEASKETPKDEATSAAASEEARPVSHSPIMPVKIKPVQEGADGVSKAAPNIEQAADIDLDSLALYTTQGDGGLSPDLWNGIPRSEIVEGFHDLPVPLFSPVQRDLTLRLLLTKAAIEKPSNE